MSDITNTQQENKQIFYNYNNLTSGHKNDYYTDVEKKVLFDDFYGAGSENAREEIQTTLSSNRAKNIVNASNYHKENIDLSFSFPDWTYGDWVNERNIWQRGLYAFGGEPNWFYFKIFFKFQTQHGLLGGLLNDADVMETTNSAGKFLKLANETYDKSKLLDRLIALKKFASILSRIQTHTPWFFKSVKGLDKASYTGIEFGKEKSIELSTSGDSVDLRLTTLFELYKFACYDDINHREIIPENLRKFEMSVLIYSSPISFLHDSLTYGAEQRNFKSVLSSSGVENKESAPQVFNNTLSYKIYTFKNCEFVLPELGSLMPNDVNNENPFKIADGSILKITYDKCYVHTSNEIMGMMFGSDGFYYNQYKAIEEETSLDIGTIKDDIILNLRYKALKDLLTVDNRNNLNAGDLNNKNIYFAANELSNAIFDSQQNLNNRTFDRKITSDNVLYNYKVPIFRNGLRRLDNFLSGPITAAINASKNYLTNTIKGKLNSLLSKVTSKGKMFASLNKSNGINNIGRSGNYFSGYMSDDDGDGKYTFKNTFKGKGSNNINNVGRSGSKYSTLMFDDDGDGEFTFKSTTFKGEGSIGRNGNTYFGDYVSDTDEDGIYEFKNTFKGKDSIGRKGGKKTNKIPFYEDLKENYIKNKNLFNNVTVSKLEREMEIETTFDIPKYDHRRADFDKPEYKPFVDTIEQNKNATNGITNKHGVRSTTFKKISGTVEALKNA